MGGQIGVRSAPGEGSTFWFTARFGKQPSEPLLNKPRRTNLEGMRVLIVDDNTTNRKILTHQLGSFGMISAAAASGQQALEMLHAAVAQQTAYEIAVLDLVMPEMDGFELARSIKSDPEIAAVSLVLLPSFGQLGDRIRAEEAGIAAYLTKPVRQSQLFECLASVAGQLPTGRRLSSTSSQLRRNMITRHTLREARPLSKKLILLAEDNKVNQRIALVQLQKLGYGADTVADGREALDRVAYDLVLMDCQMPEMDGYRATAEIRHREGQTKHTPIVAMTAHALDGDRDKCLAAGMDDYVTKPVNFEEFERVVRRFLG